MNLLGIARIGLGLIGVLAAVQGVVSFPNTTAAATLVAREHGMAATFSAVLFPFVLVWVISYYLVFRNLTLARFLSTASEDLSTTEQPSTPHVLVGLAGALILAYSLPGVTTSAGALLIGGSLSLGREFWNITIGYTAQAGLGLALVMRPAFLLDLWTRGGTQRGAV
jgi:hypothetical protein